MCNTQLVRPKRELYLCHVVDVRAYYVCVCVCGTCMYIYAHMHIHICAHMCTYAKYTLKLKQRSLFLFHF